MSKRKLGVIVGSLRKESFSRKLALNLVEFVNEDTEVEFLEIGNLPYYNEDLETDNPPAEWTAFRKQLEAMDAFMFVTPEYNRTMPAALKNALDVGSRPYGQSHWGQKPGLVVSNSPGAISGFGANHHLRQALTFLDVYTLQQPEAYIAAVHTLINDEGKVTNEDTLGFLKSIMDAFDAWATKLGK